MLVDVELEVGDVVCGVVVVMQVLQLCDDYFEVLVWFGCVCWMQGQFGYVVVLLCCVVEQVLQYFGIVLWFGYVLEDVGQFEVVVDVYCYVYWLLLGEFYIIVQLFNWQCCLCDWCDLDWLLVLVCWVVV